jgi:hypothetical protein
LRIDHNARFELIGFGKLETAPYPFGLSTPRAPDGLLLLNAPQLALADVPALPAYIAEDAALGDLLAESLEKLFLRFVRA